MGRVIAAIAVVLVVTIVAILIWKLRTHRDPIGDLDRKQERMLRKQVEEAAQIFRELGPSATFNLDDSDVLSGRSQHRINEWLAQHETQRNKEINA